MDAIILSESILPRVKQMLRLTNSDQDIFLDELILQSCRDLSTNETLVIKNCSVTVNDSRFYLPKDCKQLLAFRASDSCIPGTFVDFNFFGQCGCNTTTSAGLNPISNLLNVQGRWAYFVVAVADGSEFELSYQAIDTGEDGMVKINEEVFSALAFSAAFQFATIYPENYTPEQRAIWSRHASAQGGRARGLAARRKFEQSREQIKNKMNQMVNTSAPVSLLTGYYNSFYYPTIR